jgi:hypothetical protein
MKKWITSPLPGIALAALVLFAAFTVMAVGKLHSGVRPLTFRTTDLLVDNTATVNGTFTATNGDVTIGGTGQVKVVGGFGVQISTVSGVLTLPRVLSFNGDPNATVTAVLGSVLMDTLTPAIWQNTDGVTAWVKLVNSASIPIPSLGWFGNGADGSPTFDGASVVLGMTPVANAYTMTRDLYLLSPTCNNGVTIKMNGFRVFVATDFLGPGAGTCTIGDKGNDAALNVAGTGGRGSVCAGGAGLVAGGLAGGAGKTIFSGGDAGLVSNSASCNQLAGDGGAGGGDPGIANGGPARVTTCTTFAVINGSISNITQALVGAGVGGTAACMSPGSGGSGGGRNNVGAGVSGGGGAGGGYAVFSARHVTNPTHVTLTAAGGNGAAASTCTGGNSSGGGGGGGGGYAVLVLGSGTSPTVTVAGGNGGAGCGATGTSGANGGAGKAITFLVGS